VSRLNNNITRVKVNSKNVITVSKWDQAIAEATSQLAEIKIRAARLKAAIKVFRENRERIES
jgi:hypothetical protein